MFSRLHFYGMFLWFKTTVIVATTKLYKYKKFYFMKTPLFNDQNAFSSLLENTKLIASLRAEIDMYQKSNTELKNLNQVLKDEHQALQLAFTHIEAKLRKEQVIITKLTSFDFMNTQTWFNQMSQ